MKTIPFIPSISELEYEVSINTFNQKAKKTERTLDYIMQVKKQKDTFSNYVISFNRKDLKLDKIMSHNLIDELILSLSKVMNDLILTISPYGEIESINNLDKVKEDWESLIKYRVTKTYQGQLVEQMIENIELKINDQALFIAYIYKDPFFHNYLSTIYGEYHDDRLKRTKLVKAFGGINNLSMNTIYHLKENDHKIRTITGKGNIDESQIKKLKFDYKLEDINFIENSSYILAEERYIDSIASKKELYLNQESVVSEQLVVKLI